MNKTKSKDSSFPIVTVFTHFFKIALLSFRKNSSPSANVLMGLFFFLTCIYVKLFSVKHFYFKKIDFYDTLIISSILALTLFSLIYFVFAIPETLKLKNYENRLKLCHITNGLGDGPNLVSVYNDGKFKEKLVFKANGVSLSDFESKKSNISTAFGKIVSSLELGKNREFIEMTLTQRELPGKILYSDFKDQKLKPLSFFVGESMDGRLSQNLSELPHLLISGTSGGGKSNFFRQCLVCLIKSTPHIQLYLLDLKMGIEVVEFSELPCVRIAKDEAEAVSYLKMIELEMKNRFRYLEKTKKKRITPYDSPFDTIVIAIDEASVLFGKERPGSPKKELIDSARVSLETLSKLSRAAGIHLILATQKAVKDAIDTKVLENLQGRMVFKMMSTQGSTVALGNKRAQDLDNIKGRGIWQNGTMEVEVQTPFLTDECLMTEIEKITAIYKNGERQLRGDLFKPKTSDIEKKKELLDKIVES